MSRESIKTNLLNNQSPTSVHRHHHHHRNSHIPESCLVPVDKKGPDTQEMRVSQRHGAVFFNKYMRFVLFMFCNFTTYFILVMCVSSLVFSMVCLCGDMLHYFTCVYRAERLLQLCCVVDSNGLPNSFHSLKLPCYLVEHGWVQSRVRSFAVEFTQVFSPLLGSGAESV